MSYLPKWITPNQLTVARIATIPVLLVLIVLRGPLWNYLALALFTISCLTDYWDGYLARFRDEISPMGKLLDPIADKMLIAACLVLMTNLGVAPVVPTVVILMREFAVSGLRQVAAAEGVVIAAVRGAKVKTLLQMIAVGFLLVPDVSFAPVPLLVGQVLLWVAMVWTLWTGWFYFRSYFQNL